MAPARRFVAEGAHVFITCRRQSELERASARIGGNVTAVQGDIANLDDLDPLYRTDSSFVTGIDLQVDGGLAQV